MTICHLFVAAVKPSLGLVISSSAIYAKNVYWLCLIYRGIQMRGMNPNKLLAANFVADKVQN